MGIYKKGDAIIHPTQKEVVFTIDELVKSKNGEETYSFTSNRENEKLKYIVVSK